MTDVKGVTTITTRTKRTIDLSEDQAAEALRKHFGAPADAIVRFETSCGYFDCVSIEWTREETVENPFTEQGGDAG